MYRFILLIFCFSSLFSQNRVIDSLVNKTKTQNNDSNKVKTFNVLSRQYYMLGDYENSLSQAQKARLLAEQIHFKKGEAASYKNIGNVYSDQSVFTLALNNYLKSLQLNEELKDKLEIAKCNNNISGIYRALNQHQKAKSYLFKTLSAMEELKDSTNIARCCNNIGDTYLDINSFDSAYYYFSKALIINEVLNDPFELALSYVNVGHYYFGKTNYTEALNYYFKSLNLRRSTEDVQGSLVCYALIGQTYFYLNNYTASISYSDSSLLISKEIGDLHYQSQNYALLSQAHALIGKYNEAYQYHRLYKKYSDSIFNENNSRVLSDLKTNFEVEKSANELKAKAKAEKEKMEALAAEAKKRQTIIITSIVFVLFLVIVFLLYIYNRLKITRRQKTLIEEKNILVEAQKHLIEEKHKEITDSINYAERIQRSFLATKELLDHNLKDYFVLFKPKDVVSGDFYWASNLSNGNFALATADSTGHGVPGAIMSLLNITSLEKAIEQFNEPFEILNATRKIIIDRLKKDGSIEGGKDGMDASLTVYDFKNKKMYVSAANNPVWIVRASADSDTKEVIEIKPNKMPIGKHDRQDVSFIQEEVLLQTGDIIYTLTDGFPDQFGGEKGKKFMSKNLRELLTSNAHLPMKEQKQLLENAFNKWVGNLEQVDDVTLIGIRV